MAKDIQLALPLHLPHLKKKVYVMTLLRKVSSSLMLHLIIDASLVMPIGCFLTAPLWGAIFPLGLDEVNNV